MVSMTMNFMGTSVQATAKEACYRCEKNADLVDLDCMIVGEGYLALCSNCIKQAAEAAGLINATPEKASRVRGA
jgi:hypothetical protein